MRADLHLHTTASDGIYPPGALLALAKDAALDLVAITDHDTTNGISQASEAANSLGIQLIPGVEISAGGDDEIHILGYGIQPHHPPLCRLFKDMQTERCNRANRIIRKLCAQHMPLDVDRIFDDAKGSVGRPHIARAMVEQGYVFSVQEAFEKYLGRGKSAFVSREKLAASQVIRLIRDAGGVPVLAHPAQLHFDFPALLPLLSQWKSAGLMGLEVYHPCQIQGFDLYRRLAQRYDLIVTSGSDFHAPDKPDGPLGGMADYWKSAEEDVARLLENLPHVSVCF